MNRQKVAAELVRLARELVSANPREVFKDLRYIEVIWAEGSEDGLPSLEGKKFRSVRDAERAFEKFERPDFGYDKVKLKIVLKDGILNSFRYDHGERDSSFSKQLEWYVKHSVKLAKELV